MGNAYLRKRNLSGATKTFDELTKIAPNNPVAYTQLGRILLIQKKENDAMAMFEKALSLQPNYIEPLQYIIAVYMNKKEYRKAFDRAASQLQASPNNPFLYNMLGNLYEANRDLANAEVYLKKAIDLKPELPALHASLANFYLRQKMIDKAKSSYLTAIEKAPNNLGANMTLGMIFESEKKYDEAKMYYQKVLKINPNSPAAANNLAYIYAE